MIELHTFDDQRAQSDALAKAVGDALQASLTARAASAGNGPNHVTLAVSGGSSPRPFLQTLSTTTVRLGAHCRDAGRRPLASRNGQ